MLGAFFVFAFSPRLEGCGWFGAPNVGYFPRVWRVWSGVSLQM